jgi:hypothetical protein
MGKTIGAIGNMTTRELHTAWQIARPHMVSESTMHKYNGQEILKEIARRGLSQDFSPQSTAFEQRGICAEIALLLNQISGAIRPSNQETNDVDYDAVLEATRRIQKLSIQGQAFQQEENDA